LPEQDFGDPGLAEFFFNKKLLDLVNNPSFMQNRPPVTTDKSRRIILLIDRNQVDIVPVGNTYPVIELKLPEVKEEFFLFAEKFIDLPGIMIPCRSYFDNGFQFSGVSFLSAQISVQDQKKTYCERIIFFWSGEK
jgi:hypothetical protein